MATIGFDPALDRTIECSQRAPSDARRAVAELGPTVEAGVVRDLQLLVSELVTNSVRHSGSRDPIRLRVWTRPTGLKVEIADGGFGFEATHGGSADDAEGGRGLMILEALAERWGVSRDARARIWFELALRPVSGSARAG
jgi:anti-sigma regulatory factor (Ser/Thr protein kinase)